MAIDAHVHVWTDDRRRYPRAAKAPEYAPPRFAPEDFFARARAEGVTRAVLVQPAIYGFDNSFLLDSMRGRPGIFGGIAVVDPNSPDPGAAMVPLAAAGVRGFRVARSPGPDSMWRCAAEHGLAICLLIDPALLDAVGRMCARFPGTPVVIDHLARIGADGQIRDADTAALCRLARYPKVTVKLSAFYALGRKRPPYTDLAPVIRSVQESYGARRLMWGSDSPFQLQDGHAYTDSLALIREELDFLSPDERGWILTRTAEAMFFGG